MNSRLCEFRDATNGNLSAFAGNIYSGVLSLRFHGNTNLNLKPGIKEKEKLIKDFVN